MSHESPVFVIRQLSHGSNSSVQSPEPKQATFLANAAAASCAGGNSCNSRNSQRTGNNCNAGRELSKDALCNNKLSTAFFPSGKYSH